MIRDVHLALRALLHTPMFTLACVAMLAVGIGLSIYMFGAINAFVLKPLPFHDAERLVHFEYTESRDPSRNIDLPMIDWLDLRDRQQVLDSLAAYYQGTVNLGGVEGPPERLSGAWLSADALPVLGVQPVVGRGFLPADQMPGAPKVVVIGHRLWQLRFNAEASVIGRSVRINGDDAQVIGVMPEGFAFPVAESAWLPMPTDRRFAASDAAAQVRAFGRLKSGVGQVQAREALAALMAALAQERGRPLRGDQAKLESFADEFVLPQIRDATRAMFVAVLLVLLIACANVASLTLARFAARTRELGIRSAMGASRRRLATQVLAETLILALLATALGWLVSEGAVRAFQAGSQTTELPYWVDFRTDASDVLFSAAVAFLTALLAGLVPALQAGRVDVQHALRGGAGNIGSPRRSGRWLVIAEVALCVILLVGAGVAVRSAVRAQDVPLGVRIDQVLTGRIGLFESRYPDDAARLAFVRALQPHLAALPGVTSAGLASTLPLMGYERQEYARAGDVVDPDARGPQLWASSVEGDFFGTFDIALQRGRLFDARDTAEAPPVAIVSASLAERAWPGQDPIGQRLKLSPRSPDGTWLEVVGVVADSVQADYLQVATSSPSHRGDGNVFRPLAQNPPAFVSVALHASGDIAALSEALRDAVRRVDPDLPVYWLQPMAEWRQRIFWGSDLLARMFGVFAVFAVVLAAAGIHAVLAFDVASRTREIGVRRALGAPAGSVLSMVLRRGVGRCWSGSCWACRWRSRFRSCWHA